jgi:hypothetical protein
VAWVKPFANQSTTISNIGIPLVLSQSEDFKACWAFCLMQGTLGRANVLKPP